MPATYADFDREPSKPHQCMHESDKDGTRCRATAMHNEYMCYHHRSDDIPTVIQNDPFLIENLDDRTAIQKALTDVAARLACNHIDLKRAGLLLQTLQIASSNLPPHPRTTQAPATAPSDAAAAPASEAVILSEDPELAEGDESKDPDALHTAPPAHPIPPQNPETSNQQLTTCDPHSRYSLIHGSSEWINSSVVP
jgi:hypothetical protein